MSFRNWPVIQLSLSFGIAKKSGSVSIGRIREPAHFQSAKGESTDPPLRFPSCFPMPPANLLSAEPVRSDAFSERLSGAAEEDILP
jgi:hypothetical protein